MTHCPYDWEAVCEQLSEHAQARLAARHLSDCLGRAPTSEEVEEQMTRANPKLTARSNRACEAAGNERKRLRILRHSQNRNGPKTENPCN